MTIGKYIKKDIKSNIKMRTVIEEVEKGYIALQDGLVNMPARFFLDRDEKGDMLLGPTYIKGSGYFGVKTSTFSPQNENQSKLHGVYVLFNEKDGSIAKIYDSNPITAIRTGAKSAIAIKYLARKDSKVLGIFGMGVQAKSHIEAIIEIMPIEKVLCWSRNPKKHKDLIEFVEKEMHLEIEVCSLIDIANKSDILVDATFSTSPLVKVDDIPLGTLVIGLFHSQTAIQFDAKTVNRGNAYIDFKQNAGCGSIANAKSLKDADKLIELKDIIGKEDYRVTKDTSVYFQSGGTSLEDLAAAIAFSKAEE